MLSETDFYSDEMNAMACDAIVRGLWNHVFFRSGDVGHCMTEGLIPLQDRLGFGGEPWVDIARKVGRDRGTLHKNREPSISPWEGPPSPDARSRAVLQRLMCLPGAVVPFESYFEARGDFLEMPLGDDAEEEMVADLRRWQAHGRIRLQGEEIHPGPHPLLAPEHEQDRIAGPLVGMLGLQPALAGGLTGQAGHRCDLFQASFAPEDMVGLGQELGQALQELGIPLLSPWEVPEGRRSEYLLWHMNFVAGQVDEELNIDGEVARRWQMPLFMSTGPIMVRALGHVDLVVDGARRILFEQAIQVHGEEWARHCASWGISRPAFVRWESYPSLLKKPRPSQAFAAERRVRMAEALRFLWGLHPEKASVVQIHTHLQRVREQLFPLPEAVELLRTLHQMGMVTCGRSPEGADLYKAVLFKPATSEEALGRHGRVVTYLRELPYILEAVRRGFPGSGCWMWTAAVPLRLLPELHDRLQLRASEALERRMEPWTNVKPLEGHERGGRDFKGLLWTWLGGFPGRHNRGRQKLRQ